MCGRYSLTTPMEAVRQLFDFPERPNLATRVNIAPSQEVAAVRLEEEGAAMRHFVWLRWGLIPSWAPSGAKEPGIGNRMINARAVPPSHLRCPTLPRPLFVLTQGGPRVYGGKRRGTVDVWGDAFLCRKRAPPPSVGGAERR